MEVEVTWFDSSSDGESSAGEERNSEDLQITQDVDFHSAWVQHLDLDGLFG